MCPTCPVIEVVPAVTPQPFTDTELEQELASLEVPSWVRDRLRPRMLKGREHYNGSYCEVDLREDLSQELLDGIAYPVLTRLRYRRAGLPVPADVVERLRQIEAYASAALELAVGLPSFDGPDSNTWIARHRSA